MEGVLSRGTGGANQSFSRPTDAPILLDDATDGASFRETLWRCRHLTTGTSDLYCALHHMRQLRAHAPPTEVPAP